MKRLQYRDVKGRLHTVWVCSDRYKGKKENGCKMRRIPEADIFDGICKTLRCEQLDEAWFKEKVERVNVRENCVGIIYSN